MANSRNSSSSPEQEKDLAALLRASLEQEEPTESGTAAASDEDELTRLLREQLERFATNRDEPEEQEPVAPLWPEGFDDEEEDADEQKTKEPVRDLILYEPDSETVFNAIVPEYLAGLLYTSINVSVASELAARRTAMEAATDNAGEMIEKLSLYYNRARQASITQEITEIVAGAEGN